ncbi:MAG: NAD(P)-dependent alcohol dehydrogenase [Planctomycetaceae bacterium]|nr:NAD(P)-dependent alcohol dehydrogenase [Planctomycetaceae bacterium]
MKAYQIQSDGGIDAIGLIDVAEPNPGPGQVVVRMKAASLNFRDLIITRGGYPRNDRCPVIPLSDGAGEVLAVGEGVTGLQPGDRVVNCFFEDWESGDVDEAQMQTARGGGIDGVLAEQVIFSERALLPIPSHLSFEQAATLPCAAVTAWQALVSLGGLQAGQTVLTLGTGGVSLFALQFAKMHGARVIITSSSDDKLMKARQLGADETINYRTTPEWENEVLRLTDGRGVDNVIELGGPGTLPKSLACARVSGRVSMIGVLTGAAGDVNPMLALFNRVTMQGIYVGSRSMFQDMNQAISANKLEPIVDRVFDFSEARQAYRYLKSGSHFGKVVVRIGESSDGQAIA